jgi:hypothetical protein
VETSSRPNYVDGTASFIGKNSHLQTARNVDNASLYQPGMGLGCPRPSLYPVFLPTASDAFSLTVGKDIVAIPPVQQNVRLGLL